jgi:hypothetical protein
MIFSSLGSGVKKNRFRRRSAVPLGITLAAETTHGMSERTETSSWFRHLSLSFLS